MYRASVSADGTLGAYSNIRILASSVRSITDENLINGVTYYYRITAYDSSSYESDWAGPVSALPYELINQDTIAGKVTKKDGTVLAAVLAEALQNGVVKAKSSSLETGEYAIVGLTPGTTYMVRVTLYEGDKASVVYREAMSGSGHVDFTLNIK